jgi:hypothetical protein
MDRMGLRDYSPKIKRNLKTPVKTRTTGFTDVLEAIRLVKVCQRERSLEIRDWVYDYLAILSQNEKTRVHFLIDFTFIILEHTTDRPYASVLESSSFGIHVSSYKARSLAAIPRSNTACSSTKMCLQLYHSRGFRQQIVHFGLHFSAEHIEYTVITSLTYLKLGIA